jgi:transposase InsO family protein
MGIGYLHSVLDDHSRVVYTDMRDDETAATAVAVLRRATAWFAARGVIVRVVLSDNGACYRSHLWRDALHRVGYPAPTGRGRTGRGRTGKWSGSTAPSGRVGVPPALPE